MPDLLKITGDKTKLVIDTAEGPVEIMRKKNDMQLITGVLQPMVPIPGVTPVGELEVLAALADPEFIVVDMREPEWRVDRAWRCASPTVLSDLRLGLI
jgi:hypothetical protein